MADEKKTSWRELFISPPVIGAIISSTVAIMLFVVPRMLDDSASTPAPTATPPATEIAVVVQPDPTDIEITEAEPTEEEVPTQAEAIPVTTEPMPTDTPREVQATLVPTTAPTQTPAPPDNVLLLFDDVAFTVHNQSEGPLSLSDVRFQSANGSWDAVQWGPSLAQALPADNCLRMRDTASGQRQPPAICGNLYGFQLVGPTALFWLEVESFEVLKGDVVIATCATATATCPLYLD